MDRPFDFHILVLEVIMSNRESAKPGTGPEVPLVEGITDFFRQRMIPTSYCTRCHAKESRYTEYQGFWSF